MSASTTALIVLFTGIIIVFTVLIFLVFIIRGYSSFVKLLDKNNKINGKPFTSAKFSKKTQKDLDPEIVAAISAAVYSLFCFNNKKVKILEITPEIRQDITWRNRGVIENTKPFKV